MEKNQRQQAARNQRPNGHAVEKGYADNCAHQQADDEIGLRLHHADAAPRQPCDKNACEHGNKQFKVKQLRHRRQLHLARYQRRENADS